MLPCQRQPKGNLILENGTEFIVSGSGNPKRQFIYSKDLANLIIWVIREYSDPSPIILSVGEDDELSIKEVAESIAKAFEFKGPIKVNYFLLTAFSKYDQSKADGQYKKTASNKKLTHLFPTFSFTPIDKGEVV